MTTSPPADVLATIRAEAEAEPDVRALLERTVAVLKEAMPLYTWVGIYLLEGDELVLGPFLGKPSPHTRIPLGQGICGAAATAKATVIVDDVNADPRYLACSIETQSEIVVPVMHGSQVLGEIDIDSDRPAAFGDADRRLLESVAALLATRLASNPATRS
ncbi:MAG: L-methionine (R)-S-oxide reductase [Acidobacteriota bacterium]|jgi:GAF domain-containing protein